MYIDLLIYIAIFISCRTLGVIFLASMVSAVFANLHGDYYFYQLAVFGLSAVTLFLVGGSNYKYLAYLFIVRAVIQGLDDYSLYNSLLLVAQIIIAIDTDDTGSGKGIYRKLYDQLKLPTKTNIISSTLYWLHRKSR